MMLRVIEGDAAELTAKLNKAREVGDLAERCGGALRSWRHSTAGAVRSNAIVSARMNRPPFARLHHKGEIGILA